MPEEKKSNSKLSMPIIGMLIMGIFGAIVVAASFKIVYYWPLPVGTAPYFGAKVGFIWGLVVGAISGLAIGYLVDDSHFSDTTY